MPHRQLSFPRARSTNRIGRSPGRESVSRSSNGFASSWGQHRTGYRRKKWYHDPDQFSAPLLDRSGVVRSLALREVPGPIYRPYRLRAITRITVPLTAWIPDRTLRAMALFAAYFYYANRTPSAEADH